MKPDETFVQQVKEVLDHLYKYSYLQAHPLIAQLGVKPAGQQTAAHALRTTFLEGIEALNPGPQASFRSVQARSYSVLHLHYVERLTVKEVARELIVSDRQVYRDLRKAHEDLAALLWARRKISPEMANTEEETAGEESPSLLKALQTEARRLRPRVEEICLRPLLEGALRAVSQLAEQRGVQIRVTVSTKAITIGMDQTMSRQILVSVLSHAIQHTDKTGVTLSVQSVGKGALIVVSYTEWLESEARIPSTSLSTARQLIEMRGQEWSFWKGPQGQRLISFTLGQPRQTMVLVIDDNEGLIELFQRYLTGHGYRVIGARDGAEGLQLAKESSPDIVVLDVMMPGQDGWEVLQTLKTHPSTQPIPVMVCSIFHDPGLAFSLGAAEFLPKPVSRQELLQTLERLGPG